MYQKPFSVGQTGYPRQQRSFDHTKCIWPRRCKSRHSTCPSRLSQFAIPTATGSIPTATTRSSVWPTTHALRSPWPCAHQWHSTGSSNRSWRQTVSKMFIQWTTIFNARANLTIKNKTNNIFSISFLFSQSILISYERWRYIATGAISTRCIEWTRHSTARPSNQHIVPRWGRLCRHNIESNQIRVHRG